MARPGRKKIAPTVEELIAQVNVEIDDLHEKLKEKETELSELIKKQEQEKKDKIFDAIKNSGKSLDEVLEFLQ